MEKKIVFGKVQSIVFVKEAFEAAKKAAKEKAHKAHEARVAAAGKLPETHQEGIRRIESLWIEGIGNRIDAAFKALKMGERVSRPFYFDLQMFATRENLVLYANGGYQDDGCYYDALGWDPWNVYYEGNCHTDEDGDIISDIPELFDGMKAIEKGGKNALVFQYDGGEGTVYERVVTRETKELWQVRRILESYAFKEEYGVNISLKRSLFKYQKEHGLSKEELIQLLEEKGVLWNEDRSSGSEYQYSFEDTVSFWSIRERHPEWNVPEAEDFAGDDGFEEFRFIRLCDFEGVNYLIAEPWRHLTTMTSGGHPRASMDTIVKWFIASKGDPMVFRAIQKNLYEDAFEVLVKVLSDGEFRLLGYIGGKAIRKAIAVARSGALSWESNLRLVDVLSYNGNREPVRKASDKDVARFEHKVYGDLEGLEYGFWAQFGRAPKLIKEIAMMAKAEGVNPLTRFSVKVLQSLLKRFAGTEALAIGAMLTTNHSVTAIVPDTVVLAAIANNAGFSATYEWCGKNRKASVDTLTAALRLHNILDDKIKDMKVADVAAVIAGQRGLEEMRRIEEEYEFKFEDCEFNLPDCEATVGVQRAYMLGKGDASMSILGYDTHCCQHLDGAGETAMMYGILAPNAGFWAIEDVRNHKIKAQAEVWEGIFEEKFKDGISGTAFVFDNIEYANDGEVSRILPTLLAWCKASSYENILMGTGYNASGLSRFPKFEGNLVQPECDALESVYTDAESCVWLKKGGEVTF